MSSTIDVLRSAMQLPEADRAMIAHELLLSLEPEAVDEKEVSAAWANEISARLQRITSRTCQTHDWRQAIEEIRQELSRNDRA